MAVGDAHVFPGFLTPLLTQLFFPKPLPTFLTCICRGERQKYAEKKVCLNRGLNSQPPGHAYDTLTTKPGRGTRMADCVLKLFKTIPTQGHLLMPLGNKPFENTVGKGEIACYEQFLLFPQCFFDPFG